jgi:hypothetical protein
MSLTFGVPLPAPEIPAGAEVPAHIRERADA